MLLPPFQPPVIVPLAGVQPTFTCRLAAAVTGMVAFTRPPLPKADDVAGFCPPRAPSASTDTHETPAGTV